MASLNENPNLVTVESFTNTVSPEAAPASVALRLDITCKQAFGKGVENTQSAEPVVTPTRISIPANFKLFGAVSVFSA